MNNFDIYAFVSKTLNVAYATSYLMIKMKFVLIFDIPLEEKSKTKQEQRVLSRIGARQIQKSVWSSDELGSLTDVASFIKKTGGDARILEERFVF